MDDSDKIQRAEQLYVSFLKYAKWLLMGLTPKNDEKAVPLSYLDYSAIANEIKAISELVMKDRYYLMRAKQIARSEENEDYHSAHAARSTIIAMIIGAYLKLPKHKLIELGVAALVRDIGKLPLSPEVYLEQRPLTDNERRLLYVHPIHAYKVLKEFNFPAAICEAVLEHHELVNGSGYPQQLRGSQIHQYGKILSVACSYEAYSTVHVDEAKDGHRGMMEVLKNEGNKYDGTVIRALVYSLSVYPIGLYVLLSNGRQAQVVDADPANPRFPVVKTRGGIIKTSSGGISIVRPLASEEVGMGTLKAPEKAADGKHAVWCDSYRMGNKAIDAQHKWLFDFVNILYDRKTEDEEKERAFFTEAIQNALRYAKNHFSTEEKFMLAVKFPGYAEHKKAHTDFILAAIKSAKDYEAGKGMVREKFADFLKGWILSHIGRMDRKYSLYFRKIATRKADGKLSLTGDDIAALGT